VRRPDPRLWHTDAVRGAHGRALRVFALASAFACGSDDGASATDAAPSVPDAAVCDLMTCGDECVDTSTSTDHCGGCFQPCTPAQDCDQTCQCPTIEIAAADYTDFSQMDPDMLAPTILGVGVYSNGDLLNALVIGFDDPGTPTGTDIDLSAGDPPFVAIGYQIDITTQDYRSALRAQTGTLNLTRRCALGVAGTISSVQLAEIDPDADPPTPLAGGCTAAIESLAFDFGDPCE
jgi:hypothetical protein